ncbi:hypothetical protein [Burkholderia latens]|uniref:hypothetical protein n=1 Tax=Burkholderia latens TaxID=488446 RepID=UPI001AE10B2E|nr:hypothetical protein [Burkholderia latens]QTO49435.1 hypothetical protein J8I86_05745 [Burkholderia latens]
MSMFVWQKMSDLDARMSALVEKYGRLDGRIAEIQESVKDTGSKVSKIESKINIVYGIVLAAGAFLAGLWAIIQFVMPHISWK